MCPDFCKPSSRPFTRGGDNLQITVPEPGGLLLFGPALMLFSISWFLRRVHQKA